MMLETLRTPEIMRLVLIIGAVVAINYKNYHNVTPGGVIIPGFILLTFFLSPWWCLTLILLTFVTDWIYTKFLSSVYALRRTPMYLLGFISLILANIIGFFYIQIGILPPEIDSLVGSLLPAIICYTWTFQDRKQVLRGVFIATFYTACIFAIIYFVFGHLLGVDFNFIAPLTLGKEKMNLIYPSLQFYIALLVGYLIYSTHNVRAGGYLVAPVVAALILSPVSGTLFFLGFLTISFLTGLICQYSLTIGLSRYALSLCLSTLYVWGLELLFLHFDSTILPFKGSSLFVIIALMSYVNDILSYEKKEILLYILFSVSIAILVIFGLSWMAHLLI